MKIKIHITKLSYENINPNSLDIQAINKDERKIAFHAEINDIKSGEMSFKKEDDAIKVKCDAIFKINVRPQHVVDVMDSEIPIAQASVRLQAAQTILDRIGLGKTDRMNIDHKVSGGIFILPEKSVKVCDAEVVTVEQSA